MSAESIAAGVGLAYLVGSIPFGVVVARARGGVDLRRVGSGNVGATNVGRALGLRFALLVFVLDAAKGWAAAAVVPALGGDCAPSLPAACAVAAVLGHCFPVWLRFRGGKGAATTAGALLGLDPRVLLAGALAALGLFAAFRIMSVVSMGLVLASLAASLWVARGEGAARGLVPATAAMTAVVLARHAGNVRRLLQGTESRVGRSVPRRPDGEPRGS